MLERQVDVLAYLVAFGHGLERVVVDRRWIQVEEANPGQAVDAIEASQQASQPAALSPVDAVQRGVLGNEDELAHAARGQRFCLPHDGIVGTAAVMTAQRRNDAEGTRVVAALGDLHVRVVTGRGQDARRGVVVDVARGHRRRESPGASGRSQRLRPRRAEAMRRRGESVSVSSRWGWGPSASEERDGDAAGCLPSTGNRTDNLGDLAGAEERVNLRNFLAQGRAKALGETAGHDQSPARAGLLVPRHLENRVHGLLSGRVHERARIDHEDVGRRRVRGDVVARLAHEAEHDLGVDEILGTAEGDHADFHDWCFRLSR